MYFSVRDRQLSNATLGRIVVRHNTKQPPSLHGGCLLYLVR